MIVSCEIEIQPWTLEPSIELMIAGIKVVQLNTLSKKLSFNVVCQRNRITYRLILQLIDIIISYILIGCTCDGIVMLHETKDTGVVKTCLSELSQI